MKYRIEFDCEQSEVHSITNVLECMLSPRMSGLERLDKEGTTNKAYFRFDYEVVDGHHETLAKTVRPFNKITTTMGIKFKMSLAFTNTNK